MSDSDGYIYDEAGFDREKLAFLMDLKNVRRGRVREYAERFKGVIYTALSDTNTDFNPIWRHRAECAFPSATQNEINREGRVTPVGNGVMAVAEGANMPCTPDAVRLLVDAGVLYAPGKAANAGGVATSGLEMCAEQRAHVVVA